MPSWPRTSSEDRQRTRTLSPEVRLRPPATSGGSSRHPSARHSGSSGSRASSAAASAGGPRAASSKRSVRSSSSRNRETASCRTLRAGSSPAAASAAASARPASALRASAARESSSAACEARPAASASWSESGCSCGASATVTYSMRRPPVEAIGTAGSQCSAAVALPPAAPPGASDGCGAACGERNAGSLPLRAANAARSAPNRVTGPSICSWVCWIKESSLTSSASALTTAALWNRPSSPWPVGSCSHNEMSGTSSSGRGWRGEELPNCAATATTNCGLKPARRAGGPQQRTSSWRKVTSAASCPQHSDAWSPTLQHLAKLLPEAPSPKQPPGSKSTKPSSRRICACTSPSTPSQSWDCCCCMPPTCSAADLRRASRCSAAVEFTCSSCRRSTRPAARRAQSGAKRPTWRQPWPSVCRWCVRRRANFATGSEDSSSSSRRPPASSTRRSRSTSSCFSSAGSSSLGPPPSSSSRLRAFRSFSTDQERNSSSLSARSGLPGCASKTGSPNQTSRAPLTLRCQ
mmetsp:Transcript_34438/g.107196  ORF Transcript_34438/g.107196 Transcript_34438/m.107196 type:complete len:522 (+) Transcript_34438:784-2349(+)